MKFKVGQWVKLKENSKHEYPDEFKHGSVQIKEIKRIDECCSICRNKVDCLAVKFENIRSSWCYVDINFEPAINVEKPKEFKLI